MTTQINVTRHTPMEVMLEMDDQFQIVKDIRYLMVLKRKYENDTVSLIKTKQVYDRMILKYSKVLLLNGYNLHEMRVEEEHDPFVVRHLTRMINVLCRVIPEEIC